MMYDGITQGDHSNTFASKTPNAAQNGVVLTVIRNWIKPLVLRWNWCVFVISTGTNRNGKLSRQSVKLRVCRGMWSPALHSTIRDTWLVVIQGSTVLSVKSISKRCYEKCSKDNVWQSLWSTWYVKFLPSPRPTSVSPPTMFSPGHRRKCESRHRTWWSRRKVWLPPDG